jgi:predicted AlkP superfamily pyrophosphatase or phosphodiesterase
MRARWLCTLAFVFGLQGLAHGAEPPRLVVLIMIDQLPVRLLDRARPWVQAGLRRMLRGGASFVGEYPYAATVTAVGHAFVVTGAAPSESGIVANAWWDRQLGREVGAVEDARYHLLGRPPQTGDGTAPTQLRAEGVADVLADATHGQGQTVAVSWKDRAAILPGGQHPTAAVWFDAARLAYTSSSYYGALPAWVARANQLRPATRHVGAVWRPLSGRALEAAGPDAAPGERDREGLGIRFPHRLPTTPGAAFGAALAATPFAIDDLFALAADALAAQGLGRDAAPDLLSISVSAPDFVGHAMGADSREALDLMLVVDRDLGILFDALDKQVGAGRWAALLSSDHGSAELPERVAARLGVPVSEYRVSLAEHRERLAAALPKGYAVRLKMPWVWLTAPAASTREEQARAIRDAQSALEAAPGVEVVFTRDELASAHGRLARAVRLGWDDERAGDLFVVPEHGVLLVDDDPALGGTSHGTPWDYDQRVPILIYGARALAAPGPVSMARVAPTLAAMLGVRPPRGAHADSLLAP